MTDVMTLLLLYTESYLFCILLMFCEHIQREIYHHPATSERYENCLQWIFHSPHQVLQNVNMLRVQYTFDCRKAFCVFEGEYNEH